MVLSLILGPFLALLATVVPYREAFAEIANADGDDRDFQGRGLRVRHNVSRTSQ